VRSGIVGIGLAVAAVVALAGCSSPTTGGASAATSPAATTTAAASGGGAPKVSTPVDITKFQQTPCSGLTAGQLTTFGVKNQTGTQGTQRGNTAAGTVTDIGLNCGWLTSGNVIIVIAFTTTNKQGLGFYYWPGSTPQQLADIDGQPAINVGSTEKGACAVAVGASDTAFYLATTRNDTGGDACTLAQQIATAMTQTIKSGG